MLLKNIHVTPTMNSVLHSQINMGEITFFVGNASKKKIIFGIKQSDGQIFRASATGLFLALIIGQIPILFRSLFALSVSIPFGIGLLVIAELIALRGFFLFSRLK